MGSPGLLLFFLLVFLLIFFFTIDSNNRGRFFGRRNSIKWSSNWNHRISCIDADTTVAPTVAAISAAADYDTGAGSFAAEDTLPGSAADDTLPGSFRKR